MSLDDLALFVMVAETGGFTAAARRLSLPLATISRRVAALEQSLGTPLLVRTTRRVRLTEAGQALYERARDAVAVLRQAEEALTSQAAEPAGRLRLTAPNAFAQATLHRWVAGFLARHPSVRLEMVLTGRYVDLVQEGIDVGIRVGPLEESSLIARQLCQMDYALVAAPALLAAHGVPDTPDALPRLPAIWLGNPGGRVRWRLTGPAQTAAVEVTPRVHVNDLATAVELAADGVGMLLAPRYITAPHLAAGRLVPLLPAWMPRPRALYAVWPAGRQVLPALRAFVDFVAARAAAEGLSGHADRSLPADD